ncbi:hypothetical protein GUITHDRAFT_76208 [Guillardia theta CCMP2712]|uniref:ABC transporter domain-containing protein n=1 Tax=Guillardia theta (strain CCMP2712) TaxID=905079 RepID=L1IU74_GUITC|nr:hypothetical protein GUITHDRAFT_76208 [Guillardia theta CCMP2712]EKX39672.1 hypothetical protein GUITHDRAFT_76208 [Guillardia theta CCMP2712]|eukprot:XP_005826652.1 hypothetical protein GUITHDRAFT_76208 [Guillardia theta CCMP2712]
MTFTRLETQFISVERVAEFCRLEEEEEVTSCSHGKRSGRRAGEEIVEPPRPPASHPHGEQGGGARRRGEIVFDNVSLRYEFDKPRVLRGLNLRVRAGTKVALCGRTGCGKSSLFAALCRLYPISSGTISIDGADIATWPLKKLRSSMKVVAQDALLLEGSLLDNLTSFTGSDSPDLRRDIWRVLEHVGLKEKIDRLPGGLDANIRQDDFSEGERQLLSLSRALISTKSNSTETPLILLCDEPTSNVDYANDERVHRVILELPCTVIMICHRLQYIASFDQVVVLEDGSVLEQGSPSELLAEQGQEISCGPMA